MLYPATDLPRQSQEQPEQQAHPRRRRGATAMEYLFVISLILVVAISAIGSLGKSTKNNAQQSSDAIGKAINKGP
jgi:hypothetical protein